MKQTVSLLSVFGLAAMLAACQGNGQAGPDFAELQAQAETAPVYSADDAADDPAIWVHPGNPRLSRILGTDKHYGLMVYDLQGRQLAALERGRLNNVDLRQGILLDGELHSIAVASNRTRNSIDVFDIDEGGNVSLLLEQPVDLSDPYGICMHQDRAGTAHVFINSTDAEYQHWILNPRQILSPVLVHRFALDSQPEGCAVDDVSGRLYIGEEERGIWVLPLAQLDSARESMFLLDRVTSPYLKADIEGMDVYRRGDTAWLVVSSQGNNSYAVYDLNAEPGFYAGSFRLVDAPEMGIDGTEETDGLAVSSAGFGADYPEGLLVIQDGYNRLPSEHQNFKLLSWKQVKEAVLDSE